MQVIIIEGNITELIADEGKMLTDGETYCHDIRLAHDSDKDNWYEVDEGDVPQDNVDEPEGESK